MRIIDEIIVHCTATPRGRHVTTEEIDRWHRERGFDCIGYHYVIYTDGSIQKGRDEWKTGAHCLGHNQRSIGVAYVGGTEADGSAADTRTDAQKVALRELIVELKGRYGNARVYGHRDFAAKACPSFDARKEYSDI